ncbi:MAG: permease, partial [Dehalococcoidia bacterium]|nr:permease [Dehalococcoidia bacterium]
MLVQYLIAFRDILIDVLPVLAIGFLLSGLIHEFVPSRSVERHLAGVGIKPILYSTLVGIILPICCLGSLPVAVSLYRKGARLGPVLAFLVATPATSVTSLLVAYRLLGLHWAAFEFLAVIVMGLAMGLVGNLVKVRARPLGAQEQEAIDPVCGMNVETGKAASAEHGGETYYFCCAHCRQAFEDRPEEYRGGSRSISHRLKHVFRYAFVDMVKDIGPEMLLALALAALVATVAPVGEFVGAHLGGGLGYLFGLGFGLIMYICATASVPLVHAFVEQGMNVGAGMLILLVGPITSWGTLLVLRKEFGARVLALYLVVVSTMSVLLGYCFSLI